jgi:two-component system LytT family response regulator
MKAVIVDDEPPARRELRRMLKEYPWVQIVAEAGNIDEAQNAVEGHSPDLLFLDIQMAGGSGFDLLTRLVNVPRVIFTTAHNEHAVRAFEVNALDYLLKPIDPRRLAAAMTRVKALETAMAESRPETDTPQQTELAPGTPSQHQQILEQLFIKDGDRCWFIPLREVRLLTSEGNYVRLSWGGLQPLLGRALVSIEQRLNPRQFFRANRRQIINLDFIRDVEPGLGGRLHVQLQDGPEVEISRRQATLFRARSSV